MLKKIREALSLSPQDLAEKLEVSKALIYDIESGKREISKKLIGQFVQMGINANWLLTGEGEMFLSDKAEKAAKPSLDALVATKEDLQQINEDKADKAEVEQAQRKLKRIADRIQLSENMIEIILKRLGKIEVPEHERAYHRFVDSLAEEDEEEEEEPEEMYPLIHYGFAGAAGPLRDLDTVETKIDIPLRLLPENKKGLFVGHIEGQSMTDIIPNGTDVLLRVCSEPASGGVYVFSLRGQATIKKFRVDHTGPHFEYMDGSGRTIYPESGEKWYCNAEFLDVL